MPRKHQVGRSLVLTDKAIESLDKHYQDIGTPSPDRPTSALAIGHTKSRVFYITPKACHALDAYYASRDSEDES